MGLESAIMPLAQSSLMPLALGALSAGSQLYASRKQAKSANRALNLQQSQFNDTKNLLAPAIQQGHEARQLYGDAVGTNGREAQSQYYSDFQNDPGFEASNEFALEQINRGAAARGNSLSGNVLAALQDYSQKNQLGAFQNRLSNLSNLFGSGDQNANALAGFGQQTANNSGNLLTSAGNVVGQGIANAGNSALSAFNDFAFGNNNRGNQGNGGLGGNNLAFAG